MRRTYQKACEHCGATGFISKRPGEWTMTSSLTEICPVCNGGKTITVVEEYSFSMADTGTG